MGGCPSVGGEGGWARTCWLGGVAFHKLEGLPHQDGRLLLENAPHQYFGFEYGAISQVQPDRGSPSLLILQVWDWEIGRVA